MTTTSTSVSDPDTSAAAGTGDDGSGRGRTTLAERVVQRTATMLTREVDGVGGAAPRVLSVVVGNEDLERDARVTAAIDGDTVAIAVRCSVAYPAPVAATTETLRTHLIARLDELTGLRVRQVNITVTALLSSSERRVQ
ncbi:MAG TPA: Asp23/Gls24 family envelope stress response protein [Pseudonocardiaceae bacterium]